MMKNVLTLLLIAVVSTAANAENGNVIPRAEDLGIGAISTKLQTEGGTASGIVQNESNNLALWKTLDTDKDDLISKAEAASSEAVFSVWDDLDTNKDEKLDYIEFSQFFNLKK